MGNGSLVDRLKGKKEVMLGFCNPFVRAASATNATMEVCMFRVCTYTTFYSFPQTGVVILGSGY